MTDAEFNDAFLQCLEARNASSDIEIQKLSNHDIYISLCKRFGIKDKRAYTDPTSDLALWRLTNDS